MIAVRPWHRETSRMAAKTTDLFRTIRTGVPGSQMPAFSLLPADNVWRIITYLRSLNTNHAAADEAVTGNANAGEKTFWGKGGCGRCHEVNARGSAIGPDLSDAGKNSADLPAQHDHESQCSHGRGTTLVQARRRAG